MSASSAFPLVLPGEAILDLQPARWIWLDADRTLPNTVALFRHEFELNLDPVDAVAHISADTRYRVWLNGTQLQRGPAPSDPRVLEVDPLDMLPALRRGTNILAVEVVYFGRGEGTYVLGKPGLIFRACVTDSAGTTATVVTGDDWVCTVDRSRPPGRHSRWYLRGWQELTDLRRSPGSWQSGALSDGAGWHRARRIDVPPSQPPIATAGADTLFDVAPPYRETPLLIERIIPPLNEDRVESLTIIQTGSVDWHGHESDDWFDFRIGQPECEVWSENETVGPVVLPPASPGRSLYFTARLAQQTVGWPHIRINGPAGTTVDVITQEAHDPAATHWLDTNRNTSSRFILNGQEVELEPIEFESFRWLQLCVSSNDGPVTVESVSVRRRTAASECNPIEIADEDLASVVRAAQATLRNSAQDAVVDGMGRERQQYSGDVSHQLTEVRRFHGDDWLPMRFLRTFARGQTTEGYFLDSWPGVDRLQRIPQRELGLTQWGPILDHSVGFVFDAFDHWWQTGDETDAVGLYPRFKRLVSYLLSLVGEDGLLPVDGLGVPSVWMDHDAFAEQRDKQCAFNLYVVAMLRSAYVPLATLAADEEEADSAAQAASRILERVTAVFWDEAAAAFVSNRPWSSGAHRFDDRSLATSVLFDLCPGGRRSAALDLLEEMPSRVGRSYPANAIWRLRALIAGGRVNAAVDDIKGWSTLISVRENRTIAEDWDPRADSVDQWSHCAVAPLAVLAEGVAGLTPSAPGYRQLRIRPYVELGSDAQVTLSTPQGDVSVVIGADGTATATLPPGYRVAATDDDRAVLADYQPVHSDREPIILSFGPSRLVGAQSSPLSTESDT